MKDRRYMKESYVVTINRPEVVSVTRMKAYIKEAVDAWAGQYHPDDPMYFRTPCKVRRAQALEIFNEF